MFKVTREKDAEEQPKPMPMWKALKTTLSNRPFWLIMGLYLLSWTTASILSAMLIYFANYYLKIPDQANYFVLVAEAQPSCSSPWWSGFRASWISAGPSSWAA